MTHQANVNEPRDETTPTWVLTGDEPNGTDVVAKTWTGAAARTIDCLPATGDGDVGEGDFATPAEVDECDRAAGDPTGAPAGQCQDSVTITWTDASIDPRCDDPGSSVAPTETT